MSDTPAEDRKLYPVQIPRRGYSQDGGTVRESVYLAAYEVYAHVHGPQQAMIDHARGCRGGFSTGELIAFLYARSFPKDQWSARTDEALTGMKNL